MPSEQQHEKKYQHNKKLLINPTFDIDRTQYLDWVVTISFYSALHLIEKEISKHNEHFTGHRERGNFIFSTKEFRPIHAKYQALYNQSIRSRYNCETITKPDAKLVQAMVNQIEQYFQTPA